MVARRRDVSALHPQFRGLRRRRARGPRRHQEPLAVPRAVGVDAIWVNPWYPSPQADGGYDVADYRDIDPPSARSTTPWQLIAEAHRLGLRVLLDVVPNHTSDEHPWFRAAVAAEPGSTERARYFFRPGKGPDGALPPNDWRAMFGGPAWDRVASPTAHRASGTCTCSTPGNQTSTGTTRRSGRSSSTSCGSGSTAEPTGSGSTSRTAWSSRPGCPNWATTRHVLAPPDRSDHPHWDRPEVHDIYREWRALGRQLRPAAGVRRRGVGRRAGPAGAVPAPGRAAHRLRLRLRARAVERGGAAREREREPAGARQRRGPRDVGAVEPRHHPARDAARAAAAEGGGAASSAAAPVAARRPRARPPARPRGAAPQLALPGGAYLYQGEELGLRGGRGPAGRGVAGPDLGALGAHRARPGRLPGAAAVVRRRGRARVRPGRRAPWLPQPAGVGAALRRGRGTGPGIDAPAVPRALELRRELPALGAGTGEDVRGSTSGRDVVAFPRRPGFTCIVNVGTVPAAAPGTSCSPSDPDLAGGELAPTPRSGWRRSENVR